MPDVPRREMRLLTAAVVSEGMSDENILPRTRACTEYPSIPARTGFYSLSPCRLPNTLFTSEKFSLIGTLNQLASTKRDERPLHIITLLHQIQ